MIHKNILPKIVVAGFQVVMHMRCASFRHLVMQFCHQGSLWQSDQPHGLMHPLKNQFPFMTYKKNLTQNRLCRSTDIAAYALCQFSAAVATFGAAVWSPRRPLAK